jgi:hypothetical protein
LWGHIANAQSVAGDAFRLKNFIRNHSDQHASGRQSGSVLAITESEYKLFKEDSQ